MNASLQRLLSCSVLTLALHPALAAEPIKIAQIDPLSGPFANISTGAMRAFQAEFGRINEAGGVLGRSFELVPLDNKSSPQESTLQVQAAIDQGIRYILQAAGSNNGHAVSDAVAKHNARNPQQPVLYLNYGALDPALTEEKCHFWHFRFVPHGHMIMSALVGALARDREIKRVYVINQDYVWGHSVAKDAAEMLAVRRPDIQIVGADLHPLGKVKDFAPYDAGVPDRVCPRWSAGREVRRRAHRLRLEDGREGGHEGQRAAGDLPGEAAVALPLARHRRRQPARVALPPLCVAVREVVLP